MRPNFGENRKSARNQAFTLLEVLVAMTITVISVLAISSAFSYARRTAHDMQQQTAALHAARGIMEQFRSLPYGDTRLGVCNNEPIPESFAMPSEFRARSNYSVSPTGGAGGFSSGTRSITVEVGWVDIGGKAGRVTLTTTHSEALH